MIHVVFVAPYFGQNTRHTLRCFADLPEVKLSVLTQEAEAQVPAELRARLSGFGRVGDAQDPRQLVDGARRIHRECGAIDRLESHLEQMQVPVAEARDALDLPGIRADVALNFRDKNRMKEVLRAAGVPVARQALVRNADDARRFAQEVGFPIVLKPLAGQGAEGTQRATDDVSLSSALNALLPSEQAPAQAEEFVRGEEHTFETVMIDGQTVWSSSVRYLPSPLQVLENRWMQYCLLLPREEDLPHLREFQPINAQALRALGMRDGFSHMEWFRRADGSAVVSEVGARPPGANIMTLLSAAHDVDAMAALARLAAHRTWAMPPRRFAAGCVFLRAMGGAPTVRAVRGAKTLKARVGPLIVEAKLPQPGQPRSTHYEGDGFVLLRHPETRGVIAAMRTVLATVRIH